MSRTSVSREPYIQGGRIRRPRPVKSDEAWAIWISDKYGFDSEIFPTRETARLFSGGCTVRKVRIQTID